MGCPICGSEEYKEIRHQRVNDFGVSTGSIKYYICKGCSVMFKDKEKFFNQHTGQINDGVWESVSNDWEKVYRMNNVAGKLK